MKNLILTAFITHFPLSYGSVIHILPKCEIKLAVIYCEIKNTTNIKLSCSLFSRLPSKFGDRIHTVHGIQIFEQETQNIASSVSILNETEHYVSADVFCRSL